jgi:hypothetical protein
VGGSNAGGGPGGVGGTSAGGNSTGGSGNAGIGPGGNSSGGSGNAGIGPGGNSSAGTSPGGATSGGTSIGGNRTGGTNSGGNSTGGNSTGGSNTGGTSSGGASSGGASSGGSSTGGSSTGGTSSGGASNAGAGTGGTGPACPVGLSGPLMTQVPKPSGGYFCIDRTEVTNSQYAAFLQAAPSIAQPAFCGFNTNFAPQTSADCSLVRYDPVGQPRYPVSCIDWCDAYAFCAWAGKRLCGDLAGGAVSPGSFADITHDQWYVACTGGGTRSYPYGNTYQSMSCAGLDYPAVYPVETASTSGCEGGYPNIFDLSGNVSEWENSCYATSGATDACVHRGGGLLDAQNTSPSLRCDSADTDNLANVTPALLSRQTRSTYVGFRCCWDP